ncbi:MAG: hypothetical protein RMI91_12005 [Gemmatales bacterium]|nr:hypothetical protein [Gemmatales bacterium]MDW7995364.1 hypothetical protein [Gemmatales bacterium]
MVDRDSDVGAFDRIVVDADGSLEVRRILARWGVAVDRLQALGDVRRAAAGVEGEGRLAGLFGFAFAVANGTSDNPPPWCGMW